MASPFLSVPRPIFRRLGSVVLNLLEQELARPVSPVGEFEGEFEGLGRLGPVALDVRLDAGAPACVCVR